MIDPNDSFPTRGDAETQEEAALVRVRTFLGEAIRNGLSEGSVLPLTVTDDAVRSVLGLRVGTVAQHSLVERALKGTDFTAEPGWSGTKDGGHSTYELDLREE